MCLAGTMYCVYVPNFYLLKKIRGNIFYDQGEFDKAIEHYTKSIELNCNYNKGYSNRSLGYYRKGKYVLAIRDLRCALELTPNSSSYFTNLTNFLNHVKCRSTDKLTTELG
jgi:tetratricopeptide (TPR) repeat protein